MVMAADELQTLQREFETHSQVLQGVIADVEDVPEKEAVRRLGAALATYNQQVGLLILRMTIEFAGFVESHRKSMNASMDLIEEIHRMAKTYEALNGRMKRIEERLTRMETEDAAAFQRMEEASRNAREAEEALDRSLAELKQDLVLQGAEVSALLEELDIAQE